VAGQAAIDDLLGDVAADFLGAEEHGRQFVVVDARKDAALGDADAEAGAAESSNVEFCRLPLGRAMRRVSGGSRSVMSDSHLQNLYSFSSSSVSVASRPIWLARRTRT
jgi:hypothetical protein